MKKTLYLIFLIKCISSFATVQHPDILLIKNDTFGIAPFPLEQYFDNIGTHYIPKFKGCLSSALWRKYIAVWELKNDSLFLRRITVPEYCYGDSSEADIIGMFGNKDAFAYWVTDTLYSDIDSAYNFGDYNIYAKTIQFRFENGILKSARTKSNLREIKRLQKPIKPKYYLRRLWKNFDVEKTIKYQDTIFSLIENKINWSQNECDSMFCDDDYHIWFNKKGTVKKVQIFNHYLANETYLEHKKYNFESRECRELIKESLSELTLQNNDKKEFMIPIEIFYNSKLNMLEFWEQPTIKYQNKNQN